MATKPAPDRICTREFIHALAVRAHVPDDIAQRTYDGFVGEVLSQTGQGKSVTLTNFGTFSRKIHAGHPVRFGHEGQRQDDYAVLKFSATRAASLAVGDRLEMTQERFPVAQCFVRSPVPLSATGRLAPRGLIEGTPSTH
jgi:nucleoid DNA-binding protein